MDISPLIKFGEWLPDKGELNNPGATVAKNVVPVGEDYAPIESLSAVSDALASECLGLFSGVDKLGNPFTFAGTATKLYKLNGTAWTDVTRASGGDYATSAGNVWRFIQYGDRVLATNYTDDIQTFDVSSSTDFAALPGTPPKAKWLASINNFVVALNTESSGGVSYRVQWSGLDDPETWTPDVVTQADFQDVFDGGAAIALIGSQNSGVLLMERAIYRMDYVGTPLVFQFSLAEPNRGCSVAGSVVGYSGNVFYYGEDGFQMYDGSGSRPIGYEKVDNWFKANVDSTNLYKMRAAVNPRREQVIWAFPANGSSVNNRLLIYNYASARWSYAETTAQALAVVFQPGTLTDDISDLSDSLDILTDSSAYAGGRAFLGAVDSLGRVCSFSGTNLTAEIETTEARLHTAGRAFVWSVLPVADCASMQVELKVRDGQTGSTTDTGLVDVGENGEAYFSSDARYHRARVVLTGSWNRAQGVQMGFRMTGKN
jgi:hypothetical protein